MFNTTIIYGFRFLQIISYLIEKIKLYNSFKQRIKQSCLNGQDVIKHNAVSIQNNGDCYQYYLTADIDRSHTGRTKVLRKEFSRERSDTAVTAGGETGGIWQRKK